MLKMILLLIAFFILSASPVFAVSDPRLTPNNKFGINILSPESEIKDAATLVNSKGDWGYVVITITKSQEDIREVQDILNQTNQNHLIPIIRLATQFDSKNGYWQSAKDEDAKSWADFLSKLYFPTKNRYIEVYNEVNSAAEWGGKVDPTDYAKQLSNTIDALKAKSDNFFILNAPLDLSLPNSKTSEDAASFFADMNSTIPGIFDKLDGWASHSYPNPNFTSSPYESGKTGIDGFSWELSQISQYSSKGLPVFITETGWKRAEPGKTGLTEDLMSQYYQQAFADIWNDNRVVAVAPFVLSYPQPLFNQFSFRVDGSDLPKTYYRYFFTIADLPKVKGEPKRENAISSLKINKEDYLIENIGSIINFEFNNVGNYVWNSKKDLSIKILGANILVSKTSWNSQYIYPGQQANASISIKSIIQGVIPLEILILDNGQVLGKKEITIHSETILSLFTIRIKSASAVFKTGLASVRKRNFK